jgi:preprotein translocase subunit SecE
MWLKISTFVTEVRAEFGKVSWPSRESLMNSTNVVLLFSIGFAVIVGLFDLVVSFIRSVLLG